MVSKISAAWRSRGRSVRIRSSPISSISRPAMATLVWLRLTTVIDNQRLAVSCAADQPRLPFNEAMVCGLLYAAQGRGSGLGGGGVLLALLEQLEKGVVGEVLARLEGGGALACKLRDSGLPAAAIAEEVERLKDKVRIFAVIDTLEYLRSWKKVSLERFLPAWKVAEPNWMVMGTTLIFRRLAVSRSKSAAESVMMRVAIDSYLLLDGFKNIRRLAEQGEERPNPLLAHPLRQNSS